MDAQQLQKIFEKEFDLDSWIQILRENLNVEVINIPPRTIDLKENPFDAKAYGLGELNTKDGQLIGLYKVDVPKVKQLHRNKVGLRDLLKSIYKNDVDGALIVFVQDEKWRFSYVSEVTFRNKETGKREDKKTDSKRYTYLLGKGEKAKTAAERFSKIQQTDDLFGAGVTLKALEDAFNVEKMSKEFFNNYRKHYGYFLTELIGEDENGKSTGEASNQFKTAFRSDNKKARDFIKKLLGRIVFLYFLEKKGWLGVPKGKNWGEGDENFLSNLFKDCKDKESFYALVLQPLFFETLNKERTDDLFDVEPKAFSKGGYDEVKIPFLNGGLFENEDELTSNLIFSGDLFKNLFGFFDQYNFTVYEDSPNEHTVAVDPEMLGHIFENLLEDNKDKGAFYTPKEIVHYMCQESLIEYLCTKLSEGLTDDGQTIELRSKIEAFIKNQEFGGIAEYDEAILRALKEVKVCDPAIGSGAFPMGILLEIYHAVENLFNAMQDTTERVWEMQGWQPAKVKLNIIQNSIYGVDIEPGAVDIARLRFWLSLVVDEEVLPGERPKPLPNLDYKITVGDSLLSKFDDQVINIDWAPSTKNTTISTKEQVALQRKLLHELFKFQKQYFNSKGIDKRVLQLKIRNIKIDILINQIGMNKEHFVQNNPIKGGLLPTSQDLNTNNERDYSLADFNKSVKKLETIKANDKAELSFFDWKLNFPEILNEEFMDVDFKQSHGFDIVIGNPPYLGNKEIGASNQVKFKAKFDFSDDMYVYFFHESFKILKDTSGILSFITPNTFISLSSKLSLRNFFLKRKILELTKVGYVFEVAFVDTAVTIIKNQICSTPYDLRFKDASLGFQNPDCYKVKSSDYYKAINSVFFIPNRLNLSILNKINYPLKELHSKYWSFIDATSSSRKNKVLLGEYRKSLTQNSITLLGLISEGGQGLVTGNNSKYLAIICNSQKQEDVILKSLKEKIIGLGFELADGGVSKIALYDQAERIKLKLSKPAIFGKFYIYRTILESNVTSYTGLDEVEKLNGTTTETWIKYNRGNEDGLKWSVPYSNAILWTKDSVKELKESKITNSRWQGSEFYESSGFGWVDYFTASIKGYFIEPAPYSKNVVKMTSVSDLFSDKFILGLLNSRFATYYIKNFITTTHTLQINDGKLFPLLVNKSIQTKIANIVDCILEHSEDFSVSRFENEINNLVYKLYNLTYQEASEIEGNTTWLTEQAYHDLTT